MVEKLSIISIISGLLGSFISAYLFSIGKLSFEQTFWIMIGLLFFMVVMIYQDLQSKLDNMKFEQKRLNEKLKIYDRLAKLEVEVFK